MTLRPLRLTMWDNVMMEMDVKQLRENFARTRQLSEHLSNMLTTDEHMLQSMPDASPTKWHLAHTSWFFDTFILKPRNASAEFPDYFSYLFNSYYNGVGPQFRRAQRGLIARPSLDEVWSYRFAVEEKLQHLWNDFTSDELALVELGIHHEQQHQELIVTDIKHALSFHPLFPAIIPVAHPDTPTAAVGMQWQDFPEGEFRVGCDTGFCFDNEMPRHLTHINGFRLANRCVTNGEYLAFIEDKGYQRATLWLSEGWTWVNETRATAPLYWHWLDGAWHVYTLGGLQPLRLDEPVCHVNYFEANAFAAWSGKRLPTEYEWEIASTTASNNSHFLNPTRLHPQAAERQPGLQQMFGDVWEWTQSAYLPYPGYRPAAGAVGEYNGKFMVNQWVLRGGSCATPAGHIRASYRNFFPVNASWQFSGVRLADELD
ncbi:ergothioneine biosynthesis protein EgtB [Cellvibrio sp. ARAG 10.3]|uniref:ergothioneine biosynthesis protein EgtB n=1 Tax=Cellvibrio sp. ARAG 10.3 TaxID=3451358 RepID=UPI003F477E1E